MVGNLQVNEEEEEALVCNLPVNEEEEEKIVISGVRPCCHFSLHIFYEQSPRHLWGMRTFPKPQPNTGSKTNVVSFDEPAPFIDNHRRSLPIAQLCYLFCSLIQFRVSLG